MTGVWISAALLFAVVVVILMVSLRSVWVFVLLEVRGSLVS